MEKERRELERQREQMGYVENERREDEFQLSQEESRALKRVDEGRATPVDILLAALAAIRHSEPQDDERAIGCEVLDPLVVLDEAGERELRELLADCTRIGELDARNRRFWAAMVHLCEDSLQASQTAITSVQQQVRDEIDAMLRQKSTAELEELEGQIEEQRRLDTNTDYWEAVLVRLKRMHARHVLKEIYLEMRKRQSSLPPARRARDRAGDGAGTSSPDVERAARPPDGQDDAELPEELDDLDRAQQAPAAPISDGRFSPRLLPELGREDLALVIEEEDDASQLAEVRHRARRSMPKPTQPDGAATSAASLVEIEARKGMGSGEARFSFEVPLEDKVEWWHDKYRPRKPKYFNRVHTGYEWNKYNQTHYDHDNPPPKMVQGYKFNIFYPDLIDRSKTPSYSLLPDPSGATDTCLLRFHGGAPYEDIAFKIVNQEWETSHKRGFRCKFERGILQLYFNFKRHRYRR